MEELLKPILATSTEVIGLLWRNSENGPPGEYRCVLADTTWLHELVAVVETGEVRIDSYPLSSVRHIEVSQGSGSSPRGGTRWSAAIELTGEKTLEWQDAPGADPSIAERRRAEGAIRFAEGVRRLVQE
jgi:hypothetical protein